MEFDVITRDIIAAKNAGADGTSFISLNYILLLSSLFCKLYFVNNEPEGIVIGILLANGQVDEFRMGVVRSLCLGLTLTFHRAFEFTTDPVKAMESIIKLGTVSHAFWLLHN